LDGFGRRKSSWCREIGIAGLLAIAWLFGAAELRAQDAAAEEPAEEPAEQAEEEDGFKISFHGFLTQAYGRSDGNQVLGIGEDGTANYRAAAIQVRADMTPKNVFALQLQHERFGASSLQQVHDDVELDWVFYERRFSDSELKVGRVPIPFGIYNEVRDVGTVLPFYRPPTTFYGEGSFTREAVDGLVVSHRRLLGERWQFSGDLYYGSWEFTDTQREVSRATDALGIEIWLETPLPGLRLGVGGLRYDVQDPQGAVSEWETFHLSIDADFGRIKARAEYRELNFGIATSEAGYLQLGVGITSRLTLNGQIEYADLPLPFPIRPRGTDALDDDLAFGVNYQFRPDLILKAEHHWNEGYRTEVPRPDFRKPPAETEYWLISLSTSF
jgi:hypothetical protein